MVLSWTRFNLFVGRPCFVLLELSAFAPLCQGSAPIEMNEWGVFFSMQSSANRRVCLQPDWLSDCLCFCTMSFLLIGMMVKLLRQHKLYLSGIILYSNYSKIIYWSQNQQTFLTLIADVAFLWGCKTQRILCCLDSRNTTKIQPPQPAKYQWWEEYLMLTLLILIFNTDTVPITWCISETNTVNSLML